MVALRTADGKTANVPVSALAPESQALLPQAVTVADTKPVRVIAPSAPRTIGGVPAPTAEDIAKFKTTFTDVDTTKYDLMASFGPQTLTKKAQSSAFKTGKIPFRVTASLYKSKMVGGKSRSTRMEGSGYIVILDETGAVVDSKRENLAKLCPS